MISFCFEVLKWFLEQNLKGTTKEQEKKGGSRITTPFSKDGVLQAGPCYVFTLIIRMTIKGGILTSMGRFFSPENYANHSLIKPLMTHSNTNFFFNWPITSKEGVNNKHPTDLSIALLYTIFALPGSSGWQNSPTRTTQLKTRLDAAVAMRVYSISAGRTLH